MIEIDNSMLQDILSCSTRAWVKYVQHKWIREQDPKQSERMQVGTLFHKLFERCLSRMGTLANLCLIAEVWLRDLSTYFRDYDVLATEQRFDMGLSETVMFFGTPDAVL